MNKNNIIESIVQINSIVTEKFGPTLKCSAEDLFKQGGCYEFTKILQNFYKDSELYIKRDFTHCAVKIDEELYDCGGIVSDKENYVEANDAHIYILENYFNPYYKLFNIANTINEMFSKKQNQM